MIEVEIFSSSSRRWERIPNGPWWITPVQFMEARRQYMLDATANRFGGLDQACATIARQKLRDQVPNISDFDAISLAYGVTATRVRIYEIKE